MSINNDINRIIIYYNCISNNRIRLASSTVTISNQFANFNDASNEEMYANLETTFTIVISDTILNNETTTPNGHRVVSCTNNVMKATSKGDLPIQTLPPKSKIAHKMNIRQNLLSLSVLVDDNLVSVLDKNKITVCKENTISIR